MSKTKVELVNRAYKQLRISGLTTQPQPEEIQDALETLEDMMQEFKSRNICSSYVFEQAPLPNTDSRLEAQYNQAVETNLAVRLVDMYGLEIPRTLNTQAIQSLSNWSARSARVNPVNPPNTMPRGSGNTFRFSNWRRFNRTDNDAPISCDTFQIKLDEINNFPYSFVDYLNDGETITSWTTEVNNGLELLNIAETSGVFALNVKATGLGYQAIKLTITTSEGRVNPQILNFNVGITNGA
jgi:hypothetical protein